MEGVATAREHEQMLAHLAECAECRKAVFLMHPGKETKAAEAAPVKGWTWRRPWPVALPAAATVCLLIAAFIYLRPRGSAPEMAQQTASLKEPEVQLPANTVAPNTKPETVAPSGRSKKSFAPGTAAPNPAGQEKHAPRGLNLPQTKSDQTAADLAAIQTTAAAPSVSVPAADEAAVPQSVTPKIQAELPLIGRNFMQLQSPSTPSQAQAAAAQNGLAKKKDLPALEAGTAAAAPPIEVASEPDATLAGLTGHITDPSGAVVAGATVTLRDATGQRRRTTTSADGSFRLTGLPAGHYELIATASGFTAKQQSIDLKPSEVATLQAMLDVGTASEVVEVQASAQQAQTETATVAEISGGGRIMPLPSGLPVATTVSRGKRFLSLDNAGNLFLSRNGGKKWKKIDPQWGGKAVGIEVAAPTRATAVFHLTNDAGVVWTSKDGLHWHQQ